MRFDISSSLVRAFAMIALVIFGLRRSKSALSDFRYVKFGSVGTEVLRIDESKELISAPSLQMFQDAIDLIIDTIDNKAVNNVAYNCEYAIKHKKPLHVIINTDGGDLIAARAIRGTLQHFAQSGHEIRVIVRGKCYSAGMTVLMAVGPELRYAVKGSDFMVHACSCSITGWRGPRSYGLDRGILETIAENSRIERSSLAALLKSGKRCFFTADDALTLGVIGRVI